MRAVEFLLWLLVTNQVQFLDSGAHAFLDDNAFSLIEETTRVTRPQIAGDKAMFKTSDYLIISAAVLSFVFSVSLWFGWIGPVQRDAGIFVGIWVPSILSFGIYFKTIAGKR